MATLVAALGIVLVFEGLIFALLPGRLDDLAALLARIPLDTRRLLGLTAVALGVVLLWIWRMMTTG
ncbi:MAG: DUF2065 domain-containing protein [Pseudomonadota bacterium]